MDDAAGKVLFSVALLLYLGGFEILFPAQAKQTLSGRVRNILLTGITLGLGGAATSAVFLLIPAAVRRLPDRGLLWSIVVALAYALLTDFLYYWYHRLQHATQFLWAIHELHHSDQELNATTSMRTYWLERPVQALCIGIPVGYLVGLDRVAGIMVSFVLTGWFFFAHANWRLRMGFLTPLICGPQLHRIHHSMLAHHRDRNFAQFFPFIDMIFGTYYSPSKNEFPATGTPELRSDASIAAIMVRPFRLWAGSIRGLASS